MAIPIAVAAGAAKLLAIPGVKQAALAGAEKIAANVYGRVMGEKSNSADAVTVAEAVAGLPTREEIVASFALLQSELDRRHRHTFYLLIGVAVLQLIMLTAFFLHT
ncbi:MAG TPA: hypothetical protein VF628_08945 [Allosphingosinicella sp.]|jgi:hypothetical protein